MARRLHHNKTHTHTHTLATSREGREGKAREGGEGSFVSNQHSLVFVLGLLLLLLPPRPPLRRPPPRPHLRTRGEVAELGAYGFRFSSASSGGGKLMGEGPGGRVRKEPGGTGRGSPEGPPKQSGAARPAEPGPARPRSAGRGQPRALSSRGLLIIRVEEVSFSSV